MSVILVLNMGMKSIRSIILQEDGTKLATAALPLSTSLAGQCVTQNPYEWWEKAERVIAESLKDIDGKEIDYITVTTSSSCLVYVDKNGIELGPCIMVSDKRAYAEEQILNGCREFPELKKRIGLGADLHLMLPKILWIKRHQPEIYEKLFKVLSPNDFFVSKFTDRYITDYMNAHKFHYDIEQKEYPIKLLEELEIPLWMFPEVAAPGSYVGNIKQSVAEKLGISKNAKIILSTYDAICSFIGSGASKAGEASDVSGTVTVFRVATDKENLIKPDKIQRIPYYECNMNIIGGSNNLGGGLIEWVKQCYYQNEAYPYELMEKDASEAPLGAGGAIFLPYLLGERAPIWDHEARGVFFGLERMHTRKEMTRAVFESTGFIDLDMIHAIEETGIEIDNIRLSGGLSRVNLISQIKADVTGKEVYVLSEFETTAIGAAMIALFGQKVYKTMAELVENFVKIRMIIPPDHKNYEMYQEVYQLYKETYFTLKPLFPKRIKMTDKLYRKRQVRIENL